MIARASSNTGAAVPNLTRTTTTTMIARGTTECIAMHNGQWSALLSKGCVCTTWATASRTSRTRQTTVATPKVLNFGQRSLRECARTPVNETSSRRLYTDLGRTCHLSLNRQCALRGKIGTGFIQVGQRQGSQHLPLEPDFRPDRRLSGQMVSAQSSPDVRLLNLCRTVMVNSAGTDRSEQQQTL
jgi:hypothetical protein